MNDSDNRSDSKSVFLTWTDHEEHGGSTVTVVDRGATSDTNSKDRGIQQTQYNVEDGGVVENTRNIEKSLKARSNGNPDDCITTLHATCHNINWTCVADIGVNYASCGFAVVTGNLAGVIFCIADSGVSLAQAATNEHCSLCDDTEVSRVEACNFPDTGSGPGPGSP